MPQAKSKSGAQVNSGPANASARPLLNEAAEVLTLGETATYLRVPAADVLRMIQEQGLPGRLIGTEWRFLIAGLREWLHHSPAVPSKAAVLSCIGGWKDDTYLPK